MKILHRLVILCFAAACSPGVAADDARAVLYSFNDLYRLTVSGAADALAFPSAGEPQQVRVASVQAAPASELRFTVTPVPGPGRWVLILAGLAAAAWVAHRRLTRPL